MLNKLRERRDDQSGFTLIELLVVILIIGILAAIALPAFLGQRAKGQDSSAKSDARNMVTQVESCFATSQRYADCDDTTTQGGVTVNSITGSDTAGSQGFTIVKNSETGNTFTITKSGNTIERTCTRGGTEDGGCPSSLSW